MFRDMRRVKQQISEEECVSVLRDVPRGVLSVQGEDGYPYGLPMDFVYSDEKIYFHCAKEGHKLDAIKADSKVSFCVMDDGFKKDGDWALNIKSVIVFGKMRLVSDSSEAQRYARLLGEKYYPTAIELNEELAHSFSRVQILELTIEHMTGKLVHEK